VLSVPLMRELFHFSGNASVSLAAGSLAAFAIWLASLFIKRIIVR
jgi:hypothetical protein